MKKIIIDKAVYWYNRQCNWLFHDNKGTQAVFMSNFTESQINQIIEQLNY